MMEIRNNLTGTKGITVTNGLTGTNGATGTTVTTGRDYKVSYKVMLLGDSGVGKTSLARALRGDEFIVNLISTVGLDFVSKYFLVDQCPVRLQVWDTAGQERFRTITKFHYRGAKGLVLVFDLTDKITFEQVTYWFNTLEEKDLDAEQVFLVGNKCDLQSEREISRNKAQQFANHRGIKYFETSCKMNMNVEEVFHQLALDILEANHPQYMAAYNKTLKEHYEEKVSEDAKTKPLHGDTATTNPDKKDIVKLVENTNSFSSVKKWNCC